MTASSPRPLRSLAAISLAGALALSLAACQEQEVDLEADAEDMGGGELIMDPVDPDAVPVDVPDAEMTNVPADQMVDDDGAMMAEE